MPLSQQTEEKTLYRLTSEFLFLAEFFSAHLIIPTQTHTHSLSLSLSLSLSPSLSLSLTEILLWVVVVDRGRRIAMDER
jgi:hypothetical protein